MKIEMNLKHIIVVICCVLVSCNASKKVLYMQDAANQTADTIGIYKGVVVQPNDMLSIIVSSRNAELASAFNLPMYNYVAGGTTETFSYSYRMLGYLVDVEGYIEFRVLGKLKVAGLTREQLSEIIEQKLIQEGYIKDPIVNVDIMNFTISILGEVRSPGSFNITRDKITLLEAISRAGDMTIYGRRDNVLIRREQNGVVTYHRVDLRNTETLERSPAFYLQQNDVVYIEPNKVLAERSGINEYRTVGVWISMASFLTSASVLVINLINNNKK